MAFHKQMVQNQNNETWQPTIFITSIQFYNFYKQYKLVYSPVIHETWDEYVRLSQFGDTQLWSPNAYSPNWKAHMCSARWGPWWFWDDDACVMSNKDVELLPPDLIRIVFASSKVKCAPASDGWFGIDGYARLPLNL